MSINLSVPFHPWELHFRCWFKRKPCLTVPAHGDIPECLVLAAWVSSSEGPLWCFRCKLGEKWHLETPPRFVAWLNLQRNHGTHLGETWALRNWHSLYTISSYPGSLCSLKANLEVCSPTTLCNHGAGRGLAVSSVHVTAHRGQLSVVENNTGSGVRLGSHTDLVTQV